MPTYFVGGGGNDGNSGLTWALRKLTLNGAEDVPVVAGDTVIVGAGVYREMLTADVSGGAGTEIVYVGDIFGNLTDGVGGTVRITGSDNDQALTRAYCVSGGIRDYRVFRGFQFDMASSYCVYTNGASTNWTIEDCGFQSAPGGIYQLNAVTGMDWIIKRCLFLSLQNAIYVHAASARDSVGTLIENNIFIGSRDNGLTSSRLGDCTLRNNTFVGSGDFHFRVGTSQNAGHPWIVENNIFQTAAIAALRAAALGDITENHNTFSDNTADRSNVNVGANSQTYSALFEMPILHSGDGEASGYKMRWDFGALSQWSQIRAIVGNNEPATDFHGIRRPATAAKNSWGAAQFVDMEVETGTVQAGTYARVLYDAGCVLVRRIPVTGAQITVGLYVRRETNYAGNLPRMIIKQVGQADQITTMTAAVNTWEELTDTFTPAALPGFVEIWLESRNTAAALAYNVFYDTMSAVLA